MAILADVLNNKGIGSISVSYMLLYGNFAVIIAMSYVQARQQANTHKKLILYNENLIEADRLKDKIMATEMSFLQAQIKPPLVNLKQLRNENNINLEQKRTLNKKMSI